MDGLKPGRIVYLVLSERMAAEIMRRRTTASSIVDRLNIQACGIQAGTVVHGWPAGAQAHVGNPVTAGDIVPAMVVALLGNSSSINLKAQLDGSDTYWATSVPFDEVKAPGTWHWMFDGQQKRYDPATVKT